MKWNIMGITILSVESQCRHKYTTVLLTRFPDREPLT